MYLFLAALGLCCCMRAFSSCAEEGLPTLRTQGLLIVVASLVAGHRLSCARASVVLVHGLISCGLWDLKHPGFSSCGSVVVTHRLWNTVVACGLKYPSACGIFPDQGLNPCPLLWQMDSYPLCHQGNPIMLSLN